MPGVRALKGTAGKLVAPFAAVLWTSSSHSGGHGEGERVVSVPIARAP